MKKIISMLLTFALCLSVLSFSAFAQNIVNDYTDDEKESIYLKYTNNEHMLDALFNSDKAIGYWSMVNDIEDNGFLKWTIDRASRLIGEYPDEQDYAEILANLVMMQSGDIAEQVQNQSQYDDLKNGVDYVMDVVDIVKSFIGGAELFETVSPIIDAVTDGAEVIIKNQEQAKYYETSIRDYSQTKLFLDAVAKYADNDELKDTAKSLLKANDTLLEKRLEYLGDVAGSLVEYGAKFFVENMSFALLKTADLYASDETVKWYVDSGEKLKNLVKTIYAKGEFAFRMTMLAGDIGFGTSDTFNRYQEMKIVSDVAGAIVEANSQIITPKNADEDSALTDIQTKCDYYKMLISIHARGEYLVYQLLVNDAGLLSEFRVLFDYFKEPGETTDSWYAKQIDCMTDYYDILERMFEVLGDKSEIYKEYALIVTEREKEYGSLSFLDLMDFDNDEIEEMVLYYIENESSYGTPTIKFEIYQYNMKKKKVQLMVEEYGSCETNGGYNYVSIWERESKKYLHITKWTEMEIADILYNSTGIAKVFSKVYLADNWVNKIDDKEVSEQEYDLEYGKWFNENRLSYQICPLDDGDPSVVKNVELTYEKIKEVKKKLGLETKSEDVMGKENDLNFIGDWYSDMFDEENNWSQSYKTTFHEDGTVEHAGWRNRDKGTYEISGDKTHIIAYFNENYLDMPGQGYMMQNGYEYTATYWIDGNKLMVTFSDEFYDKMISNAMEGTLYRSK